MLEQLDREPLGGGASSAEAPGEQQALVLHLWDFAGQQQFYHTHQFFLGARALFVLVVDVARAVEAARVRFWCATLRAHAPEAPVVVVGTKTDTVDEAEWRDRFRQLREQAMALLGGTSRTMRFEAVSAKDGRGVAAVRRHVVELAEAQPYVRALMPLKWRLLEQLVQRVRQTTGAHYLLWPEVMRLGRVARLHTEREVRAAVGFLADMGVVVAFGAPARLRDVVFLDAQWVVDALKAVIADERLDDAHSRRVRDEQLDRVWNDAAIPVAEKQAVRGGVYSRAVLEWLWARVGADVRPVLYELVTTLGLAHRTTIGGTGTAGWLFACMLAERAVAAEAVAFAGVRCWVASEFLKKISGETAG